MNHIRVLICRVDDKDEMSEVAAFDMAPLDGNKGVGEHTLDALERHTQETGNAILRRLLQAQWALIDDQLTEAYVQEAAPTRMRRDGHATVTAATRFGRVDLSRQVCVRVEDER